MALGIFYNRAMGKQPATTTINSSGLTYKNKAAGSPFIKTASMAGATMSCFLCGKHRPRDHLKKRNLFGKSQSVCSPSCKELDATLAVR